MSVTARAWLGLAQLTLVMLLCLFLPARSLDYWQGWLFTAVFIGCSAAITLYLQRHDLALLERRLAVGPRDEQRPLQKVIQAAAGLMFVAILVIAGFDHRFGWSHVPLPLVLAGDALVALGYWIVFVTFRENSFTSATVQTSSDQKVISTGPYAVVRHPMYVGGLVLLIGAPIALGSYYALAGTLAVTVAIVVRLLDEERLLSRELPGYDAYRARVRSRLIPRVW